MRTALDRQMMRPQAIKVYSDGLNEVITDFLQHLRSERDASGHVTELDQKLFRWSLEGNAHEVCLIYCECYL